jgi:hypothetical protein
MDTANLATCISPVLMWGRQNPDPEEHSKISKLVAFMITNADKFNLHKISPYIILKRSEDEKEAPGAFAIYNGYSLGFELIGDNREDSFSNINDDADINNLRITTKGIMLENKRAILQE